MKCRGNFKYKGLTKRDGGEFVNSKGEKVAYKESYSLKVDELTENGIYERVFKIPSDSTLIRDLDNKALYSDIILEFDVACYSSGIRLIPTQLIQK